MQSFRGILAWRKAHALLLNCNRILRRFPREYGSLRAQLRKSVESIPTNIVEGCGCESNREFARFLQHSINSADETEYHLLVARDYGILRQREWTILSEDVQEVRRMLIAYRKKVVSADRCGARRPRSRFEDVLRQFTRDSGLASRDSLLQSLFVRSLFSCA